MIQVSPYTKPSNCTDIYDVQAGIEFINEAIKQYELKGWKIPSWLYGRLAKLHEKKAMYETSVN